MSPPLSAVTVAIWLRFSPATDVANMAARLAGWINQLRCSDDSMLNMKLRNYVELLERTTQGSPSDQPELSSLNLPPILRSLAADFRPVDSAGS
ncbi:MAG UNVERIFIED_CONTAM: hypothetical protein LVR18_01715 [Planctomycetaceae bacterium]|jgi:hypothetical protein